MATSLWGKVYYQLAGSHDEPVDTYAGELRQEPGGHAVCSPMTRVILLTH